MWGRRIEEGSINEPYSQNSKGLKPFDIKWLFSFLIFLSPMKEYDSIQFRSLVVPSKTRGFGKYF